ncbi:hypothetical protein [Streptomyces sp. NPDC048224]|jgi:hypothetical protein|uniref:hypothetical protein n=1 Tax=Streptomyces sp. NPDC048224 TaxID=3154500 RepID=UPI0033C0D903
MEGWKFWWGIAAFFLGGLSTQLNGWLTYRRQRADKRADEAAARQARSDEFELQHLVEFNQLLRNAAEALHAWEQADRQFRHLRDTNSLDDDAPERRMQAHDASEAAIGTAEAQVGYILVDEIRTAAHRAVDDFYALNAMIYEGAGDHGMMHLHNQTAAVHSAIGARVRAIYAGRNAIQS